MNTDERRAVKFLVEHLERHGVDSGDSDSIKEAINEYTEHTYSINRKIVFEEVKKRLKEMLPPRVGGAKFNPFGVNRTMRHTKRGMKQDRIRKSFAESWEHGKKAGKVHVKEHRVRASRGRRGYHVKAYWRHV